MRDFAAMPDAELIVLADAGSGNCTHDAHLGLNTSDCDRCNARRELWSRMDGHDEARCLFCGEPIVEDADSGNTIGRTYHHTETQQQRCAVVDAYAQPADGDSIWHVTLPVIGLVRAKDADAAVAWLKKRIEERTGLSIFLDDSLHEARVFESEPVDYNSVENPDG